MTHNPSLPLLGRGYGIYMLDIICYTFFDAITFIYPIIYSICLKVQKLRMVFVPLNE